MLSPKLNCIKDQIWVLDSFMDIWISCPQAGEAGDHCLGHTGVDSKSVPSIAFGQINNSQPSLWWRGKDGMFQVD